MQSRNAYILGSFVIPEGATSGTRIEFDAENGEIRFYNAANQLECIMAPGNVITVYNNSISPPATVNLEGSNIYVTAGDGSHYVNAAAGPVAADVSVVEDATNTNVLMSVASTGVPYLRCEHRAGAVVNYLQLSCDATEGEISYAPDFASFSLDQHFVEGVGIRWYCADPTLGNTRGFLYDQTTGFLKSQARNGGTGAFTTENWINAALAANFTALGEVPQYKLYPDGTVKLQGGVHYTLGAPPAGTTVFTLPAGYRPTNNRLYAAAHWGSATIGRLLVQPDGQVKVFDSPTADFPLDVVSFSII